MKETMTNHPKERRLASPRVLDLFVGCGGLSTGFEKAGFEIIAGIDNWDDALSTFAYNHPRANPINADLGDPGIVGILSELGPVEVIVGGPPCQGFSISGKRDPDDPRNRLYEGFVRAVQHLRPEYFLMENVPNLQTMMRGTIVEGIVTEFEDLGYKVHSKILIASEFGVPQNRRRLFLVGQRVEGNSKLSFEFPSASHPDNTVSCFEAISDLPDESVNDGSSYPSAPSSDYQRLMRVNSSGLWNHQATMHSEITKKIISMVPDGGNFKDLPTHLQGTRRVNIAWTRFASRKPSLTIDTGHRHHFHYQYNRVPTVRESARLQSFPDSFRLLGTKTSQYRQIGNAVPPLLAEAIAKEISRALGIVPD